MTQLEWSARVWLLLLRLFFLYYTYKDTTKAIVHLNGQCKKYKMSVRLLIKFCKKLDYSKKKQDCQIVCSSILTILYAYLYLCLEGNNKNYNINIQTKIEKEAKSSFTCDYPKWYPNYHCFSFTFYHAILWKRKEAKMSRYQLNNYHHKVA